MAQKNKEVTGWTGWIAFASFMMILGGIFQFIVGLTAVLHDKFYMITPNYLITWDVTTWGWVHMVVSLIVILAGFGLLSGQAWARIVGVLIAGLSALANVLYIPYYPLWSILIITVDVLIIWALIVHGDELAE